MRLLHLAALLLLSLMVSVLQACTADPTAPQAVPSRPTSPSPIPLATDDLPAPIDPSIEPYTFTRGDIGPPPRDIDVSFDGRHLVYRIMHPPGSYEDMALPAWPQFVPVGGELPPTRRIVRYSAIVNDVGLRGAQVYTPTKPEGVYRIAVIGTGVTFGEGVKDEEVYAARLESLLRDNPPREASFEVINLGAPSVTGDLVPGIFHQHQGTYQPDFWIVAFGVNDALPMFKQSRMGYRQNLRNLMRDLEQIQAEAIFLVEPANSFYPWKAEYQEYMAIFAEEVKGRFPVLEAAGILDCHEREQGVRLVLQGDLQQVVRYRDGQAESLFQVHHQAGPGEPTIAPALYEYLDGHEVSLRTFITDVHLTPFGHDVLAVSLYGWLSHWLLQGTKPSTQESNCALWD